jgi:hypothetical protein
MKNAIVGIGLLAGAALMAGAQPAEAAVYCKYVGVPKGCVARPGVVLRPAPRAVRRGGNLGGPVNRIGPR